jgi:hypothetical protein
LAADTGSYTLSGVRADEDSLTVVLLLRGQASCLTYRCADAESFAELVSRLHSPEGAEGMAVFTVLSPLRPPLPPRHAPNRVAKAWPRTPSPKASRRREADRKGGIVSLPTTPLKLQAGVKKGGIMSLPTTPLKLQAGEETRSKPPTPNKRGVNDPGWRQRFIQQQMVGENKMAIKPSRQSHPVRDFYHHLLTGRPGADYEAHFSLALGGVKDEETMVWLLLTTTKVLVLQSSETEAQKALRQRHEVGLEEGVAMGAPLARPSMEPPLIVLAEHEAQHVRKVTFGLALQCVSLTATQNTWHHTQHSIATASRNTRTSQPVRYLWLHAVSGPPLRFMTRSKAVTDLANPINPCTPSELYRIRVLH